MFLVRAAAAADAPVALPLMERGKSIGMLTLYARSGAPYVQMQEVLPMLMALVRREKREVVADAVQVGASWPIGEPRGGVMIGYNAENILLELTLPETVREVDNLDMAMPGGVPNGHVIRPAKLSGYVNMYAADTHMTNMGMSSGRAPVRVDLDGAVNLQGTVAEGQVAYTEAKGSMKSEIMMQNRRLVRDDTERMVRWQGGELSYPTAGLQRYRPLIGAGVARNFDLQPYRVTRPSGRADFLLNTRSTVDVYVNGNRLQTLQLAAGTYTLSDFPVVNGANNLKLVITDAAGRVETKVFPVVSDGDMLARGVSSFSANGGIPQDNTHDGNGAVGSGLWRYGVNEWLTVGGNVQGDAWQQVLGGEAAVAGIYGMVHVDMAVSRDRKREEMWDTALRVDYRNVAGARGADSWQASAEYRGAEFNLPANGTDNPYALALSASYTKALTNSLNVTVGSQYRFGRNDTGDDLLLTSNLLWRVGKDWSVNVDALLAQNDGFGAQVGLTWTPNAANTVASSYNTQRKTMRADWLRRPTGSQLGLDTDIAVERRAAPMSGHDYDLAGTGTYTHSRGQIRLRQEATTAGLDRDSQPARGTTTQLSLASAVVYAGGAWGISRPVANSFAIVDGNGEVGVNPQLEGPLAEDDDDDSRIDATPRYEAQSGKLGAAVLPDLSPYTYRPVNIEVTGKTDALRALGESAPEQMVLLPAYKSGIRVRMTLQPRTTVHGILVDAQGVPLALQAGSVRMEETPLAEIEPSVGPDKNDGAERMVFTNREGEFSIHGLEGGHYVLVLASGPERMVPFQVAGNAQGSVDVGVLRVDMMAGREHSVMEVRP